MIKIIPDKKVTAVREFVKPVVVVLVVLQEILHLPELGGLEEAENNREVTDQGSYFGDVEITPVVGECRDDVAGD